MRLSQEIIFNWIMKQNTTLCGDLRVLAGIVTLPRGKGEFSMHRHYQLFTPTATFNSFQPHLNSHKYISPDAYGWMDA